MMLLGMCLQCPLSLLALCHGERKRLRQRDFLLNRCRARCQDSSCLLNLLTAATSFPSTLLQRLFNEEPITCLLWSSLLALASHVPVKINWVYGEPIRFSLTFCTVRAFFKKFHSTSVRQRKRERFKSDRGKERGFTSITAARLFLVNPSLWNTSWQCHEGKVFDAFLFLALSINVLAAQQAFWPFFPSSRVGVRSF